MTIRQHSFVISILIAFFSTVYAEVELSFEMIGIIDALELQSNKITINGQVYRITPLVKVHAMEKNKTSDIYQLKTKMAIGFNYKKGSNQITEVWILGNDSSAIGFNYKKGTNQMIEVWIPGNNSLDRIG